MRLTIFTTPVLSPLFKRFSILVLRWAGWTLVGQMPTNTPKSVVIAAPHTSNWDLPYTLMVAFALDRTTALMKGDFDAMRFVLARRAKWTERTEVTGKNGGPVTVAFDVSHLSEEQTDAAIAALAAITRKV